MKTIYIFLAVALLATFGVSAVKAQTFSETNVGQQINAHFAALQNFFAVQVEQSIINDISRSITNFLNDVSVTETTDSAAIKNEWTELYVNLNGHVAADPLAQGDSGLAVSFLQSALREDSTIYPEGLVTGFFGNMTRNAVMNLQAREGLPVTGIVNEVTFRKLAEISWPKLRTELNIYLR